MSEILGLRELQQEIAGPSEEDVRGVYQRCQRAVRLLQSEDFVEWRKAVETGIERQIQYLVKRTESEAEANRRRGTIIAVEKLFAELEAQASGLEDASKRLEDYERARTEDPVDQPWWQRGGVRVPEGR